MQTSEKQFFCLYLCWKENKNSCHSQLNSIYIFCTFYVSIFISQILNSKIRKPLSFALLYQDQFNQICIKYVEFNFTIIFAFKLCVTIVRAAVWISQILPDIRSKYTKSPGPVYRSLHLFMVKRISLKYNFNHSISMNRNGTGALFKSITVNCGDGKSDLDRLLWNIIT